MIPIPISQFFTVYVCLWIVLIAVLWFRDELHRQHNDWSIAKERLYTCTKCHLSFLANVSENITRCPRCNEMCFLKKKKRF